MTVSKNVSNTVTVIGEGTVGAPVPLSVRGDRSWTSSPKQAARRLCARGVPDPGRDGQSIHSHEAVLVNPAENVFVRPGDVVSVARDPQTFVTIGATERTTFSRSTPWVSRSMKPRTGGWSERRTCRSGGGLL